MISSEITLLELLNQISIIIAKGSLTLNTLGFSGLIGLVIWIIIKIQEKVPMKKYEHDRKEHELIHVNLDKKIETSLDSIKNSTNSLHIMVSEITGYLRGKQDKNDK
jgi:hypothetical protein